MDREIVPIREPEQPDEVDRIALEDIPRRNVHPVVVDDEVVAFERATAAAAKAPEHAIEHRTAFGLAGLQFGTDDGGEVAHVLGAQEVGLHEALDAGEPAAPGEAEAPGDHALQVEGEPLLRPPGDEMHVAAHAPEEFLAAVEQPELFRREQPRRDEFLRLAHAVDVFRDPKQRVEVAKAALAVLHVRFDEIARRAGAGDAGIALLELRIDELRRRGRHDLLVEPGQKPLEERPVAEDEARFEKRGAHRHVGAPFPQALVDGSRRVADLELQVPEHVEHRLDDALPPGGLLVGKQKQEVDVRSRRKRSAAVAARGDEGEAFLRGRVDGRVELPDDGVVDQPDDAVHQVGEAVRAGEPVPLGDELRFRVPPALVENPPKLRNETVAQGRRVGNRPLGELFQKGRVEIVHRAPRCDAKAGLSPSPLETHVIPGGPSSHQFHDRNL